MIRAVVIHRITGIHLTAHLGTMLSVTIVVQAGMNLTHCRADHAHQHRIVRIVGIGLVLPGIPGVVEHWCPVLLVQVLLLIVTLVRIALQAKLRVLDLPWGIVTHPNRQQALI